MWMTHVVMDEQEWWCEMIQLFTWNLVVNLWFNYIHPILQTTCWPMTMLHEVHASLCWCSLKAILTSTSLSSPSIVMALTHARCSVRVMLLEHPPLEGSSTWGAHSLQILEHVNWEIVTNFDTSHVLRPCCNKAIAFNLFSFGNAYMVKENLHNYKRNCPKRPHY